MQHNLEMLVTLEEIMNVVTVSYGNRIKDTYKEKSSDFVYHLHYYKVQWCPVR